MVKNSGGCKAKSFARKNSDASHSPLRLILSPDERYAIVLKIFGGSVCQVLSHDNITLNAIIRGKFRGKSKRSSIINVGSLIIISIRDFSSDKHVSDIVHVFSPFHISIFKLLPSFPSHLFHDDNSDFIFHNQIQDNDDNTIHNTIHNSIDNSIHNSIHNDDDFIHDI